MTAHHPNAFPDILDDAVEHAYSATCNCDACFATWLAMPEPTPAEREQMAREFMRTLCPSSGGELVTDWPKVSFPDLDALGIEAPRVLVAPCNRQVGRLG